MCSRLMGTTLELSYNSMELFVGSWHWLYLHRFACSITNFFPLTVVYAWKRCLDLNKEHHTSVH